MNYPKPDDTLEGFTNTGQKYAKWEIWRSETKMALVDLLGDWNREIYLIDKIKANKQINGKVTILNHNPNSKKHLPANIK